MKIDYKIILKILFEEHNFINLFWFNFHKVDEGLYRSAQITPWRLKKIIKKYNIKTIVNLRTKDNYLYQVEQEICKNMGVEYIGISLSSRSANSTQNLHRLKETLLIDGNKPMLIHCKAGADRTGFASVFYHILKGKDPKEAVKKELRLKYAYLDFTSAGLVKEIFLSYDKDEDFISWYEKKGRYIKYKGSKLGNFIYHKLLRRE